MGGLHADDRMGVAGADPRTHLAAMLATSIASLAIVSVLPLALLQAAAAAYLAANGRVRLALQCSLWFAVFWALTLAPIPGLYGVLFVSLLHMVPPFTAACALFTQSPSALMCAFSRMHLPKNVIIGLCMAFRFVTVLPEEAASILQGIRMRGIFPRAIDVLTHPALAYECLYTPLVMRVLRLSSELAASSELRGIDAGESRTSIHHVGFGWRDVVIACLTCVVCAAIVAGDVVC